MLITEKEEKLIAEMYRDGVSIPKIGEVVRKSPTTIRRWLRINREKYGLKRRRSLAEKCGANSYSVEVDCKWNLKLSRIYLIKKWANAEVCGSLRKLK